jgi:carboxylesterase type B
MRLSRNLRKFLLALSLTLPPTTTAQSSANDLDIRLSTGIFRGTSAPGSHVEKWLGIPFAQPPVGPLRFKAPVAITQQSSEIKNATTFGNACPQLPAGNLGAPISEDCLFLNVRLGCL